MPTERLSMRRIRQVLHLHFGAQASARVIAREVGVGRSTVQDYLARATAAGLGWPLAPDLTDAAIEQRLFPAPRCKGLVLRSRVEPHLRLDGGALRCRRIASASKKAKGQGRG